MPVFPEHNVPPGEWHMYRRDHELSGRSPLAGNILHPEVRWSYPLGGSENECMPIPAAGGRMDLLFAYGGCVIRKDGAGGTVWKSAACGINGIGAVADLDGDNSPEVICGTGYEVIVLAGDTGKLLFRHYVGFPLSAGTPANIILCHQFDRRSPGMHLIVPLMSAKEVLVFDFRGKRHGELAHTLWMDDAFHPTVAAADMDGDGRDELVVSKLCALYVFDVLTGTMKTSVRWTSNGERHRNYGLHLLADIDGDGAPEAVIVAERVARHIAVIDNDGRGNLTPLWDRFIEFIYPSDTTELRHTGNSLADVDGDGNLELIVSIFNARGDGRWGLEIIDAVTGATRMELPDRYLWGVLDVNGDGLPELLLSVEHARTPAPFSAVEITSVRGLRPVVLWSADSMRFAGRTLRAAGARSIFRPVQFGHDETWSTTQGDTLTVFLFSMDGNEQRVLTELRCSGGSYHTRHLGLESTDDMIFAALADVDGDGIEEGILTASDGRVLVARANKGVQAAWTTGLRLQVEGYSAARPGPVPVVYRPRADIPPRVVVPDNRQWLHQLQAGPDSVRLRWKARGRGWCGYDNCYHSAYVIDVDSDGERELLAVNPDRTDHSELRALSDEGSPKHAWQFPHFRPPAAPRVGLYEWVLTGTGAGAVIVASAYSSASMNSEETVAITLDGTELWHRIEQGEGEWGRGVGPWSAYSLLPGRDGSTHVLFLAKDLMCRLDVRSGAWHHEPWLLWHATNSVMNQPDWDFTKNRQADFGTEKDPFTAYGSPILLDADGDGEREILVAGCFGGFGVLRQDLSILWWKRTPFTDMMLRLPGIADVRGDGQPCIGICHGTGLFQCLDAASGNELWSVNLGSSTSDVVSGDIDGDGREEFVAGTTDGRLLALGTDEGGKGYIKWSVETGFSLGNPIIADADGDGLPEVLVVSGDGTLLCIGEKR